MEPFKWDRWVEESLDVLASRNLVRSVRPIHLSSSECGGEIQAFDGPAPWDRASVEVKVEEAVFRAMMNEEEEQQPGNNDHHSDPVKKSGRNLLLFSSNDYLGLSTHPAVRKAAAEAAGICGMGPRGSAVVCGYTTYHKMLESCLAELKKKQDCLLCPTGYAANMAFMTAIGGLSSLLSVTSESSRCQKVAVFSDSLNHASIIDGIRIIQRQDNVEVFVYRHCDTTHLDSLLSTCRSEKKVVITDSLFSMDGDFAPLPKLVELRRKHKFLLAIDDAHGTLVCGENGGGLAEMYGCEDEVDISIGTLSKAVGCLGGFIACSTKWKQLLLSRSRSFVFSTALPVPVVAAAHAAILVSLKEKWRRRAVWDRIHEFSRLTGIRISSPIISVVFGSEESALEASRHMLRCGFHVIAIRPPTVPPNSCRLRLTLSAAHTEEDIKCLAAALLTLMNRTVESRNDVCLPPRL